MKPKPLAEGRRGMISGVSGALAVHAGLKALRQGGTAADAAMVTSLAQIVLFAGSRISFAGIMTMVYYDAATGKVHSMNAAYNTVQEEKDPMSIPFLGTPSGRSALVPGFMAGVQAAHDRFGKLPFEKLFEPAIYFAEEGFVLGGDATLKMLDLFNTREKVLRRLPETRQIFTKENGEFYGEGDLFRQPQLAETLRRVASQGVEYMYRGEWAKKFVEAVRRDGGKMTLKDLEDYEVIWSEPLKTSYRDYEVCTTNFPNFGSATIEAFNLLECADLRRFGHYTNSAEALFWFIQITRTCWYLSEFFGVLPIAPELVRKYLPKGDFSYESRVKKETARLLWGRLQEMRGWGPLNQEAFKDEEKKTRSLFCGSYGG